MSIQSLTLMAVAQEAIEYVHTTDTVKTLASSVSAHLLKTAQNYWKNIEQDTPTDKGVPQCLHNWLDACFEAEKMAKSPESQVFRDSNGKEFKGGGLDAMPACWIQAKSNVKAAWLRGVDITQFENESKLREAKAKADKAKEAAKAKETKEVIKQQAEQAKTVDIQKLPTEVSRVIMAFMGQAEELFLALPKKAKNEEDLLKLKELQDSFLKKLVQDYNSTRTQLERIKSKVLPVEPVAKQEPVQEVQQQA